MATKGSPKRQSRGYYFYKNYHGKLVVSRQRRFLAKKVRNFWYHFHELLTAYNSLTFVFRNKRMEKLLQQQTKSDLPQESLFPVDELEAYQQDVEAVYI